MAAMRQRLAISASGHNRSLTCFADRTFEGLLYPETCRNLNECNSAFAAVGSGQNEWPVHNRLLSLMDLVAQPSAFLSGE